MNNNTVWAHESGTSLPYCLDEIAHLRAKVDLLTSDLTLLVDKNEPEPDALHYDECPYKPFADLLRWDEPENAPACTCSALHKAVYWKARWMLTKGWRQIAEREVERLKSEEECPACGPIARERDEALDNLTCSLHEGFKMVWCSECIKTEREASRDREQTALARLPVPLSCGHPSNCRDLRFKDVHCLWCEALAQVAVLLDALDKWEWPGGS